MQRGFWFSWLSLFAVSATVSCNRDATCRPGMAAITLSCPFTRTDAATVDVTIVAGGIEKKLDKPLALQCPGQVTVGVSFEKYPAGEELILNAVVQDAGGNPLPIGLTAAGVSLTQGCTDTELALVETTTDPNEPDAGVTVVDSAVSDVDTGTIDTPLANGATCKTSGTCRSGFCVDGVCCESACSGQCEACDVSGTCRAIEGNPVGTRPACQGDTQGVCAGRCDGQRTDACTYPGAMTACGAAAVCSDNTVVGPSACNGAGKCGDPVRSDCGSFRCAGGKCSQCGPNNPCPANQYCQSGLCQAKVGLGERCADNAVCTSGFCVAGSCCNRACDGDCERCSAAGICEPSPPTTVCRSSKGLCDPQETCTGASSTCPADTLRPNSFVCRTSADVCDRADRCTGDSANCPDTFATAGNLCRPAAGRCDIAESCTGNGAACPADQMMQGCDPCDDGNAATTDTNHATYGCGHRKGNWTVFDSGLQADHTTGLGWSPFGFYNYAGVQIHCSGLEFVGLTNWRLPTIDDLRKLASGCAPSQSGGSCPLSDPGCLNNSCSLGAVCDGCMGGAGPSASKEYCRPDVGSCNAIWTSSLCSDCSGQKVWTYGPTNGNFSVWDATTSGVGGQCVTLLPGL